MITAIIFMDDWTFVHELLSTCRALGLDNLVIFSPDELVDVEKAGTYGASEIISYRSPPIPTYVSRLLFQVVSERRPRLVVGLARKNVREVFGRAAQRLGAACANNCIDIEIAGDIIRIRRPVLGGGYVAVQELAGSPVFATLQPDAFKSSPNSSAKKPVVTSIDMTPKNGLIKIIDKRLAEKSGVDLSVAERVVAVGRGFRKKEDLGLAEELAGLLGAEIGCSRPISSDLKWLPEDRHIGLSGKWIRPKLYIAIGISGQIQHVVGVKKAKTILAINNDPNSPIHREADYSVIADLYEFLPVLVRRLREGMGKERG